MKVMQSGRQTVRQPFYFGRTRTLGHLILGVLANFLAYNTVRPLTEALLPGYFTDHNGHCVSDTDSNAIMQCNVRYTSIDRALSSDTLQVTMCESPGLSTTVELTRSHFEMH